MYMGRAKSKYNNRQLGEGLGGFFFFFSFFPFFEILQGEVVIVDFIAGIGDCR